MRIEQEINTPLDKWIGKDSSNSYSGYALMASVANA
jgi:hypothetical protein